MIHTTIKQAPYEITLAVFMASGVPLVRLQLGPVCAIEPVTECRVSAIGGERPIVYLFVGKTTLELTTQQQQDAANHILATAGRMVQEDAA